MRDGHAALLLSFLLANSVKVVIVCGVSLERLEHGLRLLIFTFTIDITWKDRVTSRHLISLPSDCHLVDAKSIAEIPCIVLFLRDPGVHCGSSTDSHTAKFDLLVGIKDSHLD